MHQLRYGTALLALAMGLGAQAAMAQSSNGTKPDAVEQEPAGLNEILVVAQKRVERLGDVPVAVSVVQGEQLEGLNLTSFEQMSRQVPAFTVADGASGNRITLRGISSGTNRGFEQSVGMFIDGIYTGRAVQFSSPFFDVERVEVLRGPQSVLFGKNTVAGAVSIVTARPTKKDEVIVSGGYETRFQGWDVSGVVNKVLADNFQVRVAVKHEQRDRGFLFNSLTNEHNPSRKGDVARIALAWQPGDIEVNAKYEYAFGKRQGARFQMFVTTPAQLVSFTSIDPKFETNLDLQTSSGTPGGGLNSISSHNASLRVSVPIGSANLTSDTGYISYTAKSFHEDSDFSPSKVLLFNLHEDYRQFSQEFRFVSDQNQRIAYTLGAFFQSAHYVSDPEFLLTAILANTNPKRHFDQDAKTYSAFGEMSFELLDGLRLIGGGRYVAENKNVDRNLVIYDSTTGLPVTSPAILGAMLSIFGNQNFSLSQKVEERQFTPAVTLQYKAGPQTMLYAKFARGFKSGGFDASDTLGNALPYNSESVSAFEGGIKWGVNSNLSLNMTGYYSQISNLQVQGFNGIAFTTNNAGKASTRGAELEARWRPFPGLTLAGSVAYTDARYDDYTGAACTTTQTAAWTGTGKCRQDLSGRPLTDAARWSSNVNATYEFAVAGDWNARIYAGANSRSGAFVAPDLDPLGWQKGYTTVDASVDLTTPNDLVTFSLLAKNIGDLRAKTYVLNMPLATGAKGATIIDPRTVELRATVRF